MKKVHAPGHAPYWNAPFGFPRIMPLPSPPALTPTFPPLPLPQTPQPLYFTPTPSPVPLITFAPAPTLNPRLSYSATNHNAPFLHYIDGVALVPEERRDVVSLTIPGMIIKGIPKCQHKKKFPTRSFESPVESIDVEHINCEA